MANEYTFPENAAKTATAAAGEFVPEKMSINMGPSHPSTHGVLRLQMELDGEIVTKRIRWSAICTAVMKRSPRT